MLCRTVMHWNNIRWLELVNNIHGNFWINRVKTSDWTQQDINITKFFNFGRGEFMTEITEMAHFNFIDKNGENCVLSTHRTLRIIMKTTYTKYRNSAKFILAWV